MWKTLSPKRPTVLGRMWTAASARASCQPRPRSVCLADGSVGVLFMPFPPLPPPPPSPPAPPTLALPTSCGPPSVLMKSLCGSNKNRSNDPSAGSSLFPGGGACGVGVGAGDEGCEGGGRGSSRPIPRWNARAISARSCVRASLSLSSIASSRLVRASEGEVDHKPPHLSPCPPLSSAHHLRFNGLKPARAISSSVAVGTFTGPIESSSLHVFVR